ncbi:MAG TPA: HEAT repeat domain-containing protein [Pyrinomonadaceae bacterium]|nr:HEAT repeat domain-containing protein [Pyrinomonadaceae bacterium]
MIDPSTHHIKIENQSTWVKLCRHLLAALLLILAPILLARSQTPDAALTVSGVETRTTANGTIVSVSANASLGRAQSWQDRDGFHLLIPDAGVSDLVKSGKGIKVRRVGSSIEVLLQVSRERHVQMQTIDNNLNLSVDGKLDGSSELETTDSPEINQQQTASGYSLPTYSTSSSSSSSVVSAPAGASSSAASSSGAQSAPTPSKQAPVRDTGEVPATSQPIAIPQEPSLLSLIFSGPSVAFIVILAIVGIFVVRRFRSKKGATQTRAGATDDDLKKSEGADPNLRAKESNPRGSRAIPGNASSRERKSEVRQAVTAPASLYGAYRIDQEVGKLVGGQSHRMDVLSSRASEDRRAIQSSLVKTIVSSSSSEDERSRAREALEEYGFVAREGAALLSAPDPFERTLAARSLGEIGSAAALPFLLEALYDGESIVRNQAVVSIGALKVPSAIGALLDLARNHPDVPSSLVSSALSACSVEGLGFVDALGPAASFLTSEMNDSNTFDFLPLESNSSVEDLPERVDDDFLDECLAMALSENAVQRTEAANSLAQYPVRNSVTALISLATHDPEPTVRAATVSSLASIDHESVFPAVLIGMADESREVRAAAARALSRLSFDRSAAYVNVIQTADPETLEAVATACVKAGIVSQNIDRLARGDRRQTYEAFTLVSLLAKAKMIAPIIDAIEHHTNMTVRLSAIHLLASTGEESVFDQLQQVAVKEELDEEIKTAVLEGMYKVAQAQPRDEEPPEAFVIRESVNESPAEHSSHLDV